MPLIIDERHMIDENIFKYENRLNSQVIKYVDKSPIFVTYYHVNNDRTTIDSGFKDVEALIGKKSPIRYNKIKDFPLYGLEPVFLNLEETEQGLDASFMGDGFTLPGTIRPLQHDLFMINHIKGNYLFRIIEIQYDSIKADNFYKIAYKLDQIDLEVLENLEEQVIENYTCIYGNIGTEKDCIIREEYFNKLNELEVMYDDIVNTYYTVFYNERYNCFIGDSNKWGGYKIFDPLQSVFINKHSLFNKKNSYSCIMLDEGYSDNKRKLKYENSIYNLIEKRNYKDIHPYGYIIKKAMEQTDSSFYRWRDDSIIVSDIIYTTDTQYNYHIMDEMMVEFIKLNIPEKDDTAEYLIFLRKYLRNEELTIYDIPLTLNDNISNLKGNEEMYFYTPIILFIIKKIKEEFLKKKK